MLLRIPLLFILLLSLSSCKEEGFVINAEQYIIFGSYAGECIGPQCVQLYRLTSTELFEGIDEGTYFYFVHGYYVDIGANTTAESEYGERFSSAFSSGNFHAVQFHPEKSGEAGERVLRNFLNV